MRCYLAGPMGGIPGFNFDTFDSAKKYLTALGHCVVSPADIDRAAGIDLNRTDWTVSEPERQDALARDFRELVSCDAIALLPGWQNSRGAQAERRVAEDIGLEVWHVEPWRAFAQEKPAVLVALGYTAQAGKDTVGSMMGAMAGFERIAFADALKDVACAVDPEVRNAVRYAGWEETKRTHPHARIFLQHLGTAVREHVSPTAWIDAALRQVHPGGRYVLTDCRYRNEAEAIKARGGYVVHVKRPGCGPINDHASEHELADWDFDATLVNDGDLDDLRSRVRLFLTSLPPLSHGEVPR